jgi:hypothetical protein
MFLPFEMQGFFLLVRKALVTARQVPAVTRIVICLVGQKEVTSHIGKLLGPLVLLIFSPHKMTCKYTLCDTV